MNYAEKSIGNFTGSDFCNLYYLIADQSEIFGLAIVN